jgi:hypothetical protein
MSAALPAGERKPMPIWGVAGLFARAMPIAWRRILGAGATALAGGIPRAMPARRHLAACLVALAALVLSPSPSMAQGMPSEEALRAAMVFNFLKFTEPAAEGIADAQQIRLCIAVGDEPQAQALEALSGRKVWSRDLAVVPLKGPDDVCDVLYVDSRRRWSVATERRAWRHTLTIGAYPGFAREGGTIEVSMQQNGVRFDINLVEGHLAGFGFSPQLLRLARHVYEYPDAR